MSRATRFLLRFFTPFGLVLTVGAVASLIFYDPKELVAWSWLGLCLLMTPWNYRVWRKTNPSPSSDASGTGARGGETDG